MLISRDITSIKLDIRLYISGISSETNFLIVFDYGNAPLVYVVAIRNLMSSSSM